MLRFYIAVALTAFRRQLIYRWANLAGLLTNIFFGAVFSYVIIALYHARPLAAGYDVHDTLRYTWLIQAMLMAVLPFGWQDLILTIRTGEVVSDLSKPCDFYWYWFSRELGRAVYYLLFRGLPIYAAGMLLFGIGLPDDWHVWLIYGWTLSLGIMLGVAYRYLYNIVAFWIVEARAMVTLAQTIGLFFTGSYVPLPLFPTWLRTIVDWLPFNGLMNVPTEVFLGKLSGGSLWFELGRQALWLMLFTFVVRAMTTIAARHVVAQGG